MYQLFPNGKKIELFYPSRGFSDAVVQKHIELHAPSFADLNQVCNVNRFEKGNHRIGSAQPELVRLRSGCVFGINFFWHNYSLISDRKELGETGNPSLSQLIYHLLLRTDRLFRDGYFVKLNPRFPFLLLFQQRVFLLAGTENDGRLGSEVGVVEYHLRVGNAAVVDVSAALIYRSSGFALAFRQRAFDERV